MTYYVYLLSSKKNGIIYTGVTNNLKKRVYQHKNEEVKGFTKKYKVKKLVYFEMTENIESAIKREKVLKKWNRQWKIRLIEKNNPEWEDLYDGL